MVGRDLAAGLKGFDVGRGQHRLCFDDLVVEDRLFARFGVSGFGLRVAGFGCRV